MSGRGFFVTGTDTGVGKTLVSCALLQACVMRGLKAVGMKPVAAGAERIDGVWRNDDVARLHAAGNVDAPLEDVNPYCFAAPIAPHLAARDDGVKIDLDHIAASFTRLRARADVVVVEGAGGLLVPLSGEADMATLAARLAVPVILVVGLRLGCLNHALLTAEAIRTRGLKCAGWIASHVDPAMERVDDNVATLNDRLPYPWLGCIPHTCAPDLALLAARIDIGTLLA